MSKRDELLNEILTDKQLKLIAIAGTHGKPLLLRSLPGSLPK